MYWNCSYIINVVFGWLISAEVSSIKWSGSFCLIPTDKMTTDFIKIKMEKTEKKIRNALVNYIISNDKHWTKEKLKSYSITGLTIIKTEIEIRIAQKKKHS